MFALMRGCALSTVFCWLFIGVVSFRLFTEKTITAERGGNITLPCRSSVPGVAAVYWYKHAYTGAPDDEAALVARDYMGYSDPIPDFKRFAIADDYSLEIINVSILDETTYSCLMLYKLTVDERGYTDMRVIALANPQVPMISSCNSTGQGRCTYIIGEDEEGVTLDCNIYNARPPASLMWTIGDGSVKISTHQQNREKDGLSNTSSQLWVSRSEIGETFACVATGESVNGTSKLVATLAITATVKNEKANGLSSGAKAGIVTSVVAIALIAAILNLCYRRRERRKQVRDPEELENLIQGKPVTRASLGRAARIGALYDIRTDTFQNDYLFVLKPGSHEVKRTDIDVTKIEVTTSDSFQEKCDKLNLEAELEMSLLAGMVNLDPGAYLRDERKSARTQSMSLIYEVKTINETISLSDRETQSTANLDATHVVVGIDWGGQCTVTCEYENNENNDVTKLMSDMSEELKKLKDDLKKKRHTTSDTQEGGKKRFTFRCRGDLPAVDNDKPILYNGAVEFARSLLTFVHNTNEGKGVPVTYYLMPLENFNEKRIYKEVDEGIIKQTAQVLETINARNQKVNEIRHDMIINGAFISNEGLLRINSAWNEVTAKESHFKTDLQKVVKGVRSGKNRLETLAKFLGEMIAGDMSPSKYDDEFEPYLRKIEDIKSYLRKNVKYLGKEDELVKDSKQNTYVLYVPTNSNVKVEEKNRKLFLRLSSTFSGNGTCGFIVVDQEIVSSHVWPLVVKGPAIKKYGQGTCECEDLYEEMGQPLEVCMIQVENPVPVITIPKDRTYVKVGCPNALTKAESSGEVPKWRCSKCRQLVEYGTTTKLFYCNCGQSDPGNAQYRCNDVHHSIHYIMYPKDLLLSELSKLKAMKEMNILILGEAGVGKSTWINSLQNYGSFTSFAEAMNSKKLNVSIPCSFSITQGGRSKTIKMQVSTNNEKVGQITREPRSYVVNIDDMRLCLINTPSISDVGGSDQVTTWRKKLMDYLLAYSEINAICIILKPNSKQLTEMFRLYVEEFLAHLHISAKDNIVFCFTHTRSTSYQPGDILPALDKELISVGIQATKDRYFCFDNEPFRFLACNQHDITFGDGESTYLASWNKSVEETRRLLNYIESRMKPHRVKDTIDVNDVCRITLALSELLRKVPNRIKRNNDAMKKAKQELSEEGTMLEPVREKTPKGYDINWQELKSRKQAFIIATSEKCKNLKAENETIIEAGAKFDSFLNTNLITCNIGPFVENLDKYIKLEEVKHVTLRDDVTLDAMREMKLYYKKKRKIIEKNTGQNFKTLAQVNEVLKSLFKLLHLGSSVKALTEEIMRWP